MNKRQCPQCGNELKDGDMFCDKCGQKCKDDCLQLQPNNISGISYNTHFCEKCGNQLSENDSFCRKCGTPVVQSIVQKYEQDSNPRKNETNLKKALVISSICFVLVVLMAVLGIIFLPNLLKKDTKTNNTKATISTTEITQPATPPLTTEPATEQPTTEQPSSTVEDSSYILPDSDKTRLSYNDLAQLSESELELAQNEIYARHGKKFSTDYIQEYFDNQSWYNGTIEPEDFNNNTLSKIEQDNIDMIEDYKDSLRGATSDSNRISFGDFSLVLPDGWGYDKSTNLLYEKYNHDLGYSGFLISISSTNVNPEDHFYSCPYHVLGEKDGKYYVAVEPNGIEYNYQDETARQKYETARDQIPHVISSFEFE